MLLVGLTALIDALGRRRWVATLIDVGHNPLLLYVLFTVFLNGERLFEVEDKTFKDAGKVGLWTKADSVTHFADFRFEKH